MKDSNFYNKESGIYSKSRYPKKAGMFAHYFFKERLRLTLQLLETLLSQQDRVTMLEIGCADGVVARAIWERLKAKIASFDAIDAAPGMIAVAKAQHADIPVTFAVRQGSALQNKYDVVVEIGVLNYTELEIELDAVAAALEPGGLYLCSVTADSSLQTYFKGAAGLLHVYSYARYEQELRKRFELLQVVPVGFFVPLLWKLPVVARFVQPIMEKLLSVLMPDRAHEKIYVLQSRAH